MKLITKKIMAKLQEQYPKGSDMDNQKVVCKFFCPWNNWQWFVMNQDPEDENYLWGIVKGDFVEVGSFSLSDFENHKGPYGLTIERDMGFKPIPAKECYEKLLNGEHL